MARNWILLLTLQTRSRSTSFLLLDGEPTWIDKLTCLGLDCVGFPDHLDIRVAVCRTLSELHSR